MSSVTAKDVARGLNLLRLRPERGVFAARNNDVVVNWGLSVIPSNLRNVRTWINHPDNVAVSSNKLLAFRKYRNMPVPVESFEMPDSTEDFSMAKNWIAAGNTVYCRTVTQGHSGRGIVVARTEEQLVYAPLYTKGFKAKWEYRVHVCGDNIIDMVKKGRRRDITLDDLGRDVRNYASGYIFIRDNIDVPQEVQDAAKNAVAFYGLHFGAVDIGWHPNRGAVVYEVNTAPGLTGTSLQTYINALREYLPC